MQFERTDCLIRGNELQSERTSCPIRGTGVQMSSVNSRSSRNDVKSLSDAFWLFVPQAVLLTQSSSIIERRGERRNLVLPLLLQGRYPTGHDGLWYRKFFFCWRNRLSFSKEMFAIRQFVQWSFVELLLIPQCNLPRIVDRVIPL